MYLLNEFIFFDNSSATSESINTAAAITKFSLDVALKPYVEKSYVRLRQEHPSHELAMQELEKIAYKKFKSIQYKVECVNNAGGQMAV